MSWDVLLSADHDLADKAARLLSEEHGYAFLATAAVDGAPRIHPVAPIITPTAVYLALRSTSATLRDLRRDGRFALHSSVHPPDDEEIYVRGRVEELAGGEERERVQAARTGGAELADSMVLLTTTPEYVLWSRWRDGVPQRRSWRAGSNVDPTGRAG